MSILITNYNKKQFLEKAVNSSIDQTYLNKEIIFFDDNSTDGSLDKIKKLKKKNNLKISIIYNKKKKSKISTYNHINAIKSALNKSKGRYIFLLDADDYFHKKKIDEIIKKFDKEPKSKFIMDQPILKKGSKELKKIFFFKMRKDKWPKFPPTSCMSFERKSLILALKKVDFKKFPNLAIDFRLAVYFSVILKKFQILNSHYTYYRQVDGGMDSKYKKYTSRLWWKRRKEAFEFLNYFLKKKELPTNNSLDFYITSIFNKISII